MDISSSVRNPFNFYHVFFMFLNLSMLDVGNTSSPYNKNVYSRDTESHSKSYNGSLFATDHFLNPVCRANVQVTPSRKRLVSCTRPSLK